MPRSLHAPPSPLPTTPYKNLDKRRLSYPLALRVHRYPFVEEGEPFASADGSVAYAVEASETPRLIVRDAPHAVVVFALREPAARAWSDFRHLLHSCWDVLRERRAAAAER